MTLFSGNGGGTRGRAAGGRRRSVVARGTAARLGIDRSRLASRARRR